jgi:predicted dehydrogenase
MENGRLKIGMIGTNFISDNFANAAKTVDDVRVQAIYSRGDETGRAFAKKHGIPDVYTDFEAFLAAGDIDAVYVASPNASHGPQSIAAMNRGKHVICEKPIASNAAELQRMKAASKANGVVLLEAMIPEHDPAYQIVRESMQKIGTVRRAMIEFCKYSSRYDSFRKGVVLNAFNPALSNAAIMDIGVYCIHCCMLLFGEPETVKATSVILDNGMEGGGTVSLGYKTMQADLIYSKITESSRPAFLWGEEGTMAFSTPNAPRRITITYRNDVSGDGGTEEIRIPDPGKPNMAYEIAEFARLIRAGEIDHSHMRTSDWTMAIIDEARRQNGIVFPADR